jgi:hypothetical protein
MQVVVTRLSGGRAYCALADDGGATAHFAGERDIAGTGGGHAGLRRAGAAFAETFGYRVVAATWRMDHPDMHRARVERGPALVAVPG